MPIPPLLALLLAQREQKGKDLTEAEVLECRNGAVCMTMRLSQARQLAEKRGYDDLAPESVWEDWQTFLAGDVANDGVDEKG
ncbi:hypothetical protein [Sphingomonas psychrotolerans]|uniref:Uncharacterized protein n=1 Tax=Sphingomonas psychrotolerans TaxID=1327635 RepID=A0A2K8MKZ0_9SPHN|nr:hypothetical protein [Sphingomonas psychrotolerans]ATY32419.1 hypothetical protein CVN68_10900 [Sphingomonas psychrotolerans]